MTISAWYEPTYRPSSRFSSESAIWLTRLIWPWMIVLYPRVRVVVFASESTRSRTAPIDSLWESCASWNAETTSDGNWEKSIRAVSGFTAASASLVAARAASSCAPSRSGTTDNARSCCRATPRGA